MPAPATIADFVDLIRKSLLVSESRLNGELQRLRSSGSAPQSVDQLAQALIRAGLLTRFQAKQLKIGRYKRFEIAGKYRLLELLGVGGMGAVYLCEHKFMNRLVALKVLPVEKLGEQSALPRFYREARAVAALDHPNIVRAYDIDKYEQLHFLVMEYVDGYSLQEIIARNGPLSPERAAVYIAQSANGLMHAHHLGMVHRDIKPGNLLLERTGIVKILDMGLAKFFDQKHDNVTEKFDNQSILGTADYLAPEQAISTVVDIRADIYALGGSLYFLLTGQPPFPEGTIASKLMAHQTKEPKPISHFRHDVPPELIAVLNRMMAKSVQDRFQTPDEVIDALAHWTGYPLALPPVHEMPDLCPAVLAISGHAGEKVKGAGQRSLIGSGVSLGKPNSGFPSGSGTVTSVASLSDSNTPSSPTASGGSSNELSRSGEQASGVQTGRSTATVPLLDPQLTDSSSVVKPFKTESTVELAPQFERRPRSEADFHGHATATPSSLKPGEGKSSGPSTKYTLMIGVLVGLLIAILAGAIGLAIRYAM